MNEISDQRLYEFYRDAIERCTSKTILLSDEEIEYNLYEEFDISVISFFHEDSLERLLVAGMINEKAVDVSREVRKLWNELQKRSWTTEEIKKNSCWKRLFALCDELLKLLSST